MDFLDEILQEENSDPFASIREAYSSTLNNIKTNPSEHHITLREKYNLSYEQMAALFIKKGNQSTAIRRYILEDIDNSCDEIIKHLEDAITVLPQAEYEVVYHNWQESHNSERVLKWFKQHVGECIEMPVFLSCTKGDNFTQYKNLKITIERSELTNSTVDLNKLWKELEKHETEEEILFNRNSRFVVEKVDGTEVNLIENSTCTTIIIMPEL